MFLALSKIHIELIWIGLQMISSVKNIIEHFILARWAQPTRSWRIVILIETKFNVTYSLWIKSRYYIQLHLTSIQCRAVSSSLVWGWHSNPRLSIQLHGMVQYILRIDDWAQYFRLPLALGVSHTCRWVPKIWILDSACTFIIWMHITHNTLFSICEAIWVGRHRSKKTLLRTCNWMPAHRKDSVIRPKPSTKTILTHLFLSSLVHSNRSV